MRKKPFSSIELWNGLSKKKSRGKLLKMGIPRRTSAVHPRIRANSISHGEGSAGTQFNLMSLGSYRLVLGNDAVIVIGELSVPFTPLFLALL